MPNKGGSSIKLKAHAGFLFVKTYFNVARLVFPCTPKDRLKRRAPFAPS